MSAGYSITEQTTIGERGTIDVDRMVFSARYRPSERVSVTVAPSFTRSVRDRRQVPVYALDVESAIAATRHVSLVAWGRIGRQDGTLSGPPGMIPYRTLGLKLQVAPPRRDGGEAAITR